MPRRSRAVRARLANLQKAPLKTPKLDVEKNEGGEETPISHDSQQRPQEPFAIIETSSHRDFFDDDLEILDVLEGTAAVVEHKDENSESRDDSGLDEVSGIHNQGSSAAVVEEFSQRLQRAHDLALEAEREREKGRKRPKRYAGNSRRTKRRHAQAGQALAAKGFPSVNDWFAQRKKSTVSGEPLDVGMNVHIQESKYEIDAEDLQLDNLTETSGPLRVDGISSTSPQGC